MRLLVPLFLILFLFFLLRSVLQGLLSSTEKSRLDASRPQRSSGVKLGKMEKDPVCGTYVSPEISSKLEKSGHITHFCSAECRERYGRPAARAARA